MTSTTTTNFFTQKSPYVTELTFFSPVSFGSTINIDLSPNSWKPKKVITWVVPGIAGIGKENTKTAENPYMRVDYVPPFEDVDQHILDKIKKENMSNRKCK